MPEPGSYERPYRPAQLRRLVRRASAKEPYDATEQARERTRRAERRPDDELAFVESKLRLLDQDTAVPDRAKAPVRADLRARAEAIRRALPPPPLVSAVGYGLYYAHEFRSQFGSGTGIQYHIVCPTVVGGSVSTYLYLTATNRAALGCEAYISYFAQDPPDFRVYDWSVSGEDKLRVTLPFDQYPQYRLNVLAYEQTHQTVYVRNLTYRIGAGLWRNAVLLLNPTESRFDLIYKNDYEATPADQKKDNLGFWGPIVEVFEDSYAGTNTIGFMQAQLATRDSGSGEWAPDAPQWRHLSPAQSAIQPERLGFERLQLEPNHSFLVKA
jgi:hypothetical protein